MGVESLDPRQGVEREIRLTRELAYQEEQGDDIWRGLDVGRSIVGGLSGGAEAGLGALREAGDELSQIGRIRRIGEPEPEPAPRYSDRMMDYLSETRRANTIDPASQGQAASIVNGLTRIISSAVVGGPAGFATMGGAGYRDAYDRFIAEGKTPTAAHEAALIEGGTLAAMGLVPGALGGKLWQRLVTGAGINVGLGMGQRYAMESYLRDAGYEESARNYAWLDPSYITIDAVLGMAFAPRWFGGARREDASGDAESAPPPPIYTGPSPTERFTTPESWLDEARSLATDEDYVEAYAHALIAREQGAREADAILKMIEEDAGEGIVAGGEARAGEIIREALTHPDAVSAALVTRDEIHRTIDTAPGIPATPAASRWHAETLRSFEEAALRDEPPPLIDGIPEGVEFAPRPERADDLTPAVEEMARVLEEQGYGDMAAELRAARDAGTPIGDDPGLMFSRGAGYQGRDSGEAAEWVSARNRGLDMSAEARRARAEEQGFTIQAYHGTDASFAQFEPGFRGSHYPEADSREAYFFTSNRKTAAGYAEEAAGDRAINTQNTFAHSDPEYKRMRADVMDAMRARERAVWPWTKRAKNAAYRTASVAADSYLINLVPVQGANIISVRLRLRNPLEIVDAIEYDAAEFAGILEDARRTGHDGVIFRSIRDEANTSDESRRWSDVFAVFNAEDIRSSFAAFDPEGDGGASMLASRGARFAGASPEAIAQALRSSFGKDADRLLETGKTEIVGSVGDLARVTGRPIPSDVKGVYDPKTGKTYLVAENVSPEEAARVLLHEVGVHAGMREFLGAKGYADLGRKLDELIEGGNPIAKAARERVDALVESGAMKKEHANEEALAYLVETAPDLPFVRRLLAQIRMWIWRTFGDTPFARNLTVEDIRALAVSSLRRQAKLAERAADADRLRTASALTDPNYETGSIVARETAEWRLAEAKGLDLSLEARKARAEAQGFDFGTVYFHGTANAPFTSFQASSHGTLGPGVYLALDHSKGDYWADRSVTGRPGVAQNRRVLPLVVRGEIAPHAEWIALSKQFLDEGTSMRAAQAKANEALRARGFAGAKSHSQGGMVVVFDPANIRSIHAAFDPDYRDSANLLASNPQGRELDSMGFRSVALEAAQALPSRAMKGEEAVNRILKARGVEGFTGRVQDEVDFLGLREEFAGRARVTKQEIIEHIRINRLVLEEAFNRFDPKANPAVEAERAYSIFRDEMVAKYGDGPYRRMDATEQARWNELQDRALAAAERVAEDARLGETRADIQARIGQQQAGIRRGPGDLRLPGDEPVFELRLIIPEGLPGSDFQSHWSRPPSNDKGVLVSIRGEERIDDQGKRTLFGGEVQSDLAQNLRATKERIEQRQGVIDRVREDLERFPDTEEFVLNPDNRYRPATENDAPADRRRRSTIENGLAGLIEDIRIHKQGAPVDAPLASKTSAWTGAAVRALVYRAARDGFESVSFPTGKTSETIQGNDSAAAHYDTNVKGAAQKIARAFGVELRDGTVEAGPQAWTLYVGEKQVASTYTNRAQAEALIPGYAKRAGIEESRYEVRAANQHSAYVLPITPEMRARILNEGMPLFSRSWDDLENMMGDTRSSGRGIKNMRPREDAPPNAPEYGSEEWRALAFEARSKKDKGQRLSPLEDWVLRNDEGEALFSRDPDPVKQAIIDEPDLEIPSRNGESARAADALEDAKADEADARDMGKGFDAAASCAVQHGFAPAARGASRATRDLMAGQGLGLLAAAPAAYGLSMGLTQENRRGQADDLETVRDPLSPVGGIERNDEMFPVVESAGDVSGDWAALADASEGAPFKENPGYDVNPATGRKLNPPASIGGPEDE